MATYNIAYVSNNEQDIKYLQQYVPDHFNVTVIHPRSDIKTLLEDIDESHVDALIVSYEFGDESQVPFNGAGVVVEMLAQREGFPVFILAANIVQAEEGVHDVNLVYDKKSLSAPESRFWQRVATQMAKHQKQLAQKEDRLLALMSKKSQLSEGEENEAMSLSFNLEKAMDKPAAQAFPQFTPTNSTRLKAMLEKVDLIIKEVKRDDA